ncbi:MAG: HigA family addiction module antidote protein [Candidatus Omnitrophica bacterium]|nr:HigA family addiction module antidote protein [Candidatus Omnitrophota bacterium]
MFRFFGFVHKEKRVPAHPGEILLEEFLNPMAMTQTQLAKDMGVPIQRINTLVIGKRGITPETAILLSIILKTSPEFWMNLQAGHDFKNHLHLKEQKSPIK